MQLLSDDHRAAKAYRTGTHRTCAPRETLDLLMPRMREFGITRLANVTGLDVIGVPVYMAVRPASRGVSVSQGKGIDDDSARASALMESVEGWHAERIDAPLRYESYATLRRSAAVTDVTRLPLAYGARLDVQAPLLWIEGHDLLSEAPTWVPFASVMTNFVKPWSVTGPFRASTNGLASGNHILEAIAHGLCEVIERDACSVWEAAGGYAFDQPQIDLGTVTSTSAISVINRLRAAELDIAVWDTTSDTGIPTFACRIFDSPDRARWTLKGVFGGQGCHLDPEVALLRAITEAIQSRLTSIAGSRDDMFDYDTRANPDNLRAAVRAATDSPATASFPRQGSLVTDTFDDDVEALVAALRGIGIENVVVVDLTRPEIGIPVVHVIVPGLEDVASEPGYIPGRRAREAARTARRARER
jgi:YcaO-like protein with predicted kinase domain